MSEGRPTRRRARGPAVIAALLGALLAATAASAEPQRRAVGVLPLVASGDGLSLYTRAVASAVADGLRGRSRREVVVLGDASAAPGRVALVVHGRIVRVPGDRVLLEARLRDPEGGGDLAGVATRAAALTRIDRLAEELAERLAEELARTERAAPIRLPESVVRVPGQPAPPARALAIAPATGAAAAGAIAVEGPATAAASGFARRVGRRSVQVDGDAPQIAAALERAGAEHLLQLHLEDIDFSWSGVLAARGAVRVRLWNRRGEVVVDRRVHTDTVVGDRGDRHAALVRFVAEQALDIAAPSLLPVLR